MKYYILINPFTNKPIHFTTFVDNNFVVTRRVIENGVTVVEQNNALCIEVDYDINLINKTYNPDTNTFID